MSVLDTHFPDCEFLSDEWGNAIEELVDQIAVRYRDDDQDPFTNIIISASPELDGGILSSYLLAALGNRGIPIDSIEFEFPNSP